MEREKTINRLWSVGAKYIDITNENDALPKRYKQTELYHTERKILLMIGEKPDITVTEMAYTLHKTVSICSQIIKKFVNYGWVEQIRNQENKRIYNIKLTTEGKAAYETFRKYADDEKKEVIKALDSFSVDELEIYTRIQQAINRAGENINSSYKAK